MNFQHLHELLRLELVRRIDQGLVTGTKLAQQAGFQQAHISNFLNKKRSLSLEGLDRVLAAQELTIDQLLPSVVCADRGMHRVQDLRAGLDLHANGGSLPDDPIEYVPVVASTIAMDAAVAPESSVIETIQVSASRLQGNRTRPQAVRAHWQRFLAIRVDAEQAAAMEPILTAGTIAVIDRHYNSLAPYRSHQPTLFAVRHGASLQVRFADFEENHIILRPYARSFPVQLIAVRTGDVPADYIVGRVCILLCEL